MNGQHPLIAGLLAELPEAGQPWPRELRNKWLNALGAVLDLVYPTGPAAAGPAGQNGSRRASDNALSQNQQHVLEALLRLIDANNGQWTLASNQKIAQESGVALGSMGVVVEHLVHNGFVERRIDPQSKTAEWRRPS